MKTATAGIQLIEEFEGWMVKLKDGRYQSYLDKLPRKELWSKGYRGLWTIGPGITGDDVTEGTIWTREYTEDRFRKMLAKHEVSLDAKAKKFGVKLDQNQFDALVSASWNLGTESTLISRALTLLAANREDDAANVFLEYDHAGGKKVRGLTRRRKAERELFLKHTVATLYEASRKLSWLRRGRNFITSLGVGSFLTWDNLGAVKQYASDHLGLTLLGIAVVTWVSFRAVEYFTVQDNLEGRYTPSGDVA